MNSLRIAAMAASLAATGASQAVTIVQWDLAGAPGNQASTLASASAANVAGSELARGVGLAGSAGANSINASGWNGQASDYFSFGFTVAAGYTVDLEDLYIGTRSSGTGPGTMGLFYSGDGFTTSLITFDQAPGSNFVNSVIDLGSLPDLAGNVEFRLQQIGTASANGGATGGNGTLRVTGYFSAGVFDRNTQFTGSVSAIPEPSSYAFLLLGLSAVGAAVRQRS